MVISSLFAQIVCRKAVLIQARRLFFGGFFCLYACAPSLPATTPFSSIPRAIGSYSNGCLAGAVSLPPDGKGYQFMRISRKRFYGHPSLLSFITQLSTKTAAKDSVLLIGDMAQARGGLLPGGHNSHQTGLDVDIWYWHPAQAMHQSLTLSERENISAPSLLMADGKTLNPELWNNRVVNSLQDAAGFAEVERIFVNPAVKKALCQHHQGEAWLQKIRPWWGHDDHFHVRLHCPAGDAECRENTAPLPVGDGCDKTLAWWDSKEAAVPKQSKASPLPSLKICQEIMAATQ